MINIVRGVMLMTLTTEREKGASAVAVFAQVPNHFLQLLLLLRLREHDDDKIF